MKQKENRQSVLVMSETEGKTLCLRNSGLVTAEDHKKYLRENVATLVQKFGTFNMLIVYDDDYQGYTPDAADSSIRAMLDYGAFVQKLAYVNPPETRIKLHKMLPDIFSGEVRFFDKDSLSTALTWVKS